jgi:single-strand DNA-binding protein
MSDIITLTGIVATTPRHLITSSHVAITSFRLASGQRRFDRAKDAWVDATTNWYSVSTFRQLAFNVASSIHKGDHVIVTGRLRIRDWDKPDRSGTSVDVDADSVGHDLLWCTASAVRNAPRAPQQPEPPEFPEGLPIGELPEPLDDTELAVQG